MAGNITKEDLIQLWRDTMDDAYTVPIEEEDNGRGLDIISGIAEIWAKVSLSTDISTQTFYLLPHSTQTQLPAAGATQAVGNVILDREYPKYGDIELEDGDVLEVSQLGTKGETVVVADIELTSDQSLIEGLPSPVTTAVNAVRTGYQTNGAPRRTVVFKRKTTLAISNVTVLANTLTDDGGIDRFDETMVGSYVRFTSGTNASTYPRRITSASLGTVIVDGTPLVSGTNSVEVVDINEIGVTAELDGELSGGTHGWLDALGLERLIARNPYESDNSYRFRIVKIPDLISPNAIIRAVSRVFRPYNYNFSFLEMRNPGDIPGAFWDIDPFDDPNAGFPDGNGKVMFGDGFQYRGFIILVESETTGDFGGPWDTNPATSGHPSNAWDYTPFDGYAVTFAQVLDDMVKEVQKSKSAGTPWAWALVDSI
jgi:hypothetical protein